MPKRRMTPARKMQIAQWQAAGARARKRKPNKAIQAEKAKIAAIKKKIGGWAIDQHKPVPLGKMVRLYHYTSPERAGRILKEGFTNKNGTNTMYNDLKDANYMYGVIPLVKNKWSGYGKALVSVKVPRKMLKVDESMNSYYPPPMRVAIKDLQGRKFRREL